LEDETLDPDRVGEALSEDGVLVWVDVEGPTEETIETLGKQFGFHELALEDSIHPHQRPKIEQYRTYFFLVAYGMSLVGTHLVGHELAVFVGHNYLVTVRKEPPFDLSAVTERWDAHPELTKEGGGYLLYILLDQIVDGYFDVLDVLQERTEGIEERIFRDTGGKKGTETATQRAIFQLKKELVRFRRAVIPLRDSLDTMQRRTVPVVTEALEPYYRDVYDHVLRAADFVDGIRDILSSALDVQLAVVSNRLNVIIKHLTSYAAIILVPTLIAGVYGMNFVHMPELTWRYGYPYAIAVMVLSALGLYWFFKRRDWL